MFVVNRDSLRALGTRDILHIFTPKSVENAGDVVKAAETMTRRREFLKKMSGAGLFGIPFSIRAAPPSREILAEAREIVRAGHIGKVGFCRVPHSRWLPAAQVVLGSSSADCVVEVDPAAKGTALLGGYGTLAVDNRGWRVFARNS